MNSIAFKSSKLLRVSARVLGVVPLAHSRTTVLFARNSTVLPLSDWSRHVARIAFEVVLSSGYLVEDLLGLPEAGRFTLHFK